MSYDDSVEVVIDGKRYEFTRYALSHLIDSLLGLTVGADQWRESAEKVEAEMVADCLRLAEAHERMEERRNRVVSMSAAEVRAAGNALKGFDQSRNVAFKWGRLALRVGFLAMLETVYW